MKIPKSWHDVSVFQWQQLMDLFLKNDPWLDLETLSVGILCNLTEMEVYSLDEKTYIDILNAIKFLHEPPQGEARRYINVNGKRYKCIYDVRNIKAARYIEAKHFGKDVVGNLHRIAASMVQPQKRQLFWHKDVKYDASKHEEYASDLLGAPITAVYGSVVFFCKVYNRSINNLKDYLKAEMMKAGMTEQQAEDLHQALCSFTDGITNAP